MSKKVFKQYKTITNQPGFCEICGSNSRLVDDHHHDSNIYRGQLCNNCNVGIGMFCDSISLLNNAINYLRESNAKIKYLTEDV